MRKTRWILLLAIVCILATSLPAIAQLAQGNWPRPGRDYHNSGLSPATAIAKPVLKSWAPKAVTGYYASPYYWLDFTFDGIQIDPQGNIYVQGDDEFSVIKISPAGATLWGTSITSHNYYYMYYGLSLFDDGTHQYAVAGPQQVNGSLTTDDRKVYAINPATGAASWASGLLNDSWVMTDNGVNRTGLTTNVTTTIGPDGTIYTGNFRDSFYEPTGSLFALNPDGSRKWAFNTWGQGDSYGSKAVKAVEGKNVIYTCSGVYHHDMVGTYDGKHVPNILCIRDDGTAPTLVWTAAAGFATSEPMLSADGSTLYVAGRESRPAMHNNTFTPLDIGLENFIALDADTGAIKWSLVTGSRAAFSPTLGPDGTIYVCGGYFRTGNQSATTPDVDALVTPGQLIAIQDNGASGTIKWKLPLPDDEVSDTTRVAVISTTPATMYVATGNGRVYCIQDLGDHPKILWTWQAFATRFCGAWSHAYTPANIAIADDGTIYTGWKNNLYAFETGFDPASPEGITGTVRDAGGNPIAGAWVAASTSPRPLADNANRLWTKTNSDGTYQLSPKDAGAYYVAAGAVGYEGSADQNAAFATTSTKVTGLDFTLGPARFNWALGSIASCTSANGSYPAGSAVDGSVTTRFASTGTSAALIIDLGAVKPISEAVIYWWFNYGKSYTLDYSDNGTNWTAAYTTTTGNGGLPLDYYPTDPTVAVRTGGDCNYSGGPKTSADVIKFAAGTITARYWRVNYTSARNFYGDSLYRMGPGAYGSTAGYASIWDVELRDATKAGPTIPSATMGEAKAAEDSAPVSLTDMVVTAVPGAGVPAGNILIEDPSRTAGIRVNCSTLTGIGFGDVVSVVGKKFTDANGELYIAAATLTRAAAAAGCGVPVEAVGMNNRDAAAATGQGMFVKTWGKVTGSGADYFTITDGSAQPIKVLCGSLAQPSVDDVVRVRGVAGKDASGPVLYMRNEQVDWTSGAADYQPKPFPGAYKYPQEWLVLGPFTDASSGNRDYRLDHDYIADANPSLSELTIAQSAPPAPGAAVGAKTWTPVSCTGAHVAFPAADNSVCYGHVWVYSPVTQNVSVRLGSDDSSKIFIYNADNYPLELYRTFPAAGRSETWSQDDCGGFTLSAGWTSVLVKCENGSGTSSMDIQILPFDTGASGYGNSTPLDGLGYLLARP